MDGYFVVKGFDLAEITLLFFFECILKFSQFEDGGGFRRTRDIETDRRGRLESGEFVGGGEIERLVPPGDVGQALEKFLCFFSELLIQHLNSL